MRSETKHLIITAGNVEGIKKHEGEEMECALQKKQLPGGWFTRPSLNFFCILQFLGPPLASQLDSAPEFLNEYKAFMIWKKMHIVPNSINSFTVG